MKTLLTQITIVLTLVLLSGSTADARGWGDEYGPAWGRGMGQGRGHDFSWDRGMGQGRGRGQAMMGRGGRGMGRGQGQGWGRGMGQGRGRGQAMMGRGRGMGRGHWQKPPKDKDDK